MSRWIWRLEDVLTSIWSLLRIYFFTTYNINYNIYSYAWDILQMIFIINVIILHNITLYISPQILQTIVFLQISSSKFIDLFCVYLIDFYVAFLWEASEEFKSWHIFVNMLIPWKHSWTQQTAVVRKFCL